MALNIRKQLQLVLQKEFILLRLQFGDFLDLLIKLEMILFKILVFHLLDLEDFPLEELGLLLRQGAFELFYLFDFILFLLKLFFLGLS